MIQTICQELEDLIPAYVLDALDDADRKRVEEHLPQCANCRRLVEEYQPVVDWMSFAAEQVEPRAELKYRVLAATAPHRPQAAPAPTFGSRLAGLVSTLFRSPAFAAATLVLVLAFGVWNLALQSQISQQSAELAQQRDLLQVLAYSNGEPRQLQGTDAAVQAVGRLYGSSTDSTFVVVTYDLPQLPAGKVYQLWLIDPAGKRTSGGTFTVDHQGRGWLFSHAPLKLGDYRAVGVTVEPLGGSPGPTGAKMLGGNL